MRSEIATIAKAAAQFIALALFMLLAPAAVYVDTVLIGDSMREASITEYFQEALLLLSAVSFFVLAYYNRSVRGFAILVGGFFATMLIRELDGLLDEIVHGFWVYPAIAWAGFVLFLAVRFREGLLPAMADATRSHAFVFIIIGLATVLAFSRVFGTGSLWSAVLNNPAAASLVKNTVQEGLELLGYLLILRGTVGYCREVGVRQPELDHSVPGALPSASIQVVLHHHTQTKSEQENAAVRAAQR